MRTFTSGRLWRPVVVCVALAVAAVTRPVGIVAQDAPMRWEGSIEHLSSTAEYGWPTGSAPAQMSRHAMPHDGRWVVFTADVPNEPNPPFKQFFKRDRLFGQVSAFFGAEAAAPPVISANGSYIALETCAGWLRSDGASVCDVYVVSDWAAVNASTALDGTESNAASREPMLSRDGRYLVFRTDSTTLLPPGTAPGQIVLRDRDTDGDGIFDEAGGVAIHVVSVSTAGEPGNAESGSAEVSADGRFIAFRSLASNLVVNDTNAAWDVFLHDRETGETRRINVGWDGQEATPTVDSPAISMTEDGNLIAFAADDSYLMNPPVAEPADNGALDVIVYDRRAGTLQRIDIGVSGAMGNGHTYWPTFSADGRYISMLSLATNTEEPSTVTPGRAHVYVYDRATNQATRVSRTAEGLEPNADATSPAIVADGSFVVFLSQATNLATSAASGADAVYGASHLHGAPETLMVPARGGAATLNITAQQYVSWTIEVPASTWLSPAVPSWGSGPASVTFQAYANPNPEPRTVLVRLGGQTIVVRQEAGLSLTSVSPSVGPAVGGTLVAVTGTGFEPDMSLYFDGVLTPFEFVSSTHVRAVAPAHAPGAVPVSVQTSDFRFVTRDAAYAYLEPISTAVSWNTPAPIVYGAALGALQLNATAGVPGTFVYSPAPGYVLPAGLHTLTVAFAPDDPNYAPSTATVVLEVMQATPVATATGGTFGYDGLPHAAAGSVSGVSGEPLGPLAFTYNGSPEVPVNVGTYAVVAAFAGDRNYLAVSATATLTISKATPTMIATGGTFTYDGLPHPATGTVTGAGGVTLAPLTFLYNGSPDLPVNAGIYAVVASYDGNENYDAAFASTSVFIGKASAMVTAVGGSFSYDGAPHGATGTATGADGSDLGLLTFIYNGSAEAPVNAGTYAVVASFAGDTNHDAGSAIATLMIDKATPTVTANGGTFTYDGSPHVATGTATGVGGADLGPLTFTYNGSSEVPVNAGEYAVVVGFAGNANYTSGSAAATLSIGKASPRVHWEPPAAIVYGTSLGSAQLTASASTTGTFTYTPAAGTTLLAGEGQRLSVTFTPTDSANYTAGSGSTTITVTPALLTVRADDAMKRFGTPLPVFTATATGFVNGDSLASLSGTVVLTTPATALSAVGTYPIVPSGVSSANYNVTFTNGTLTIVRALVVVGVTASPEPSGFDQPMTFTATIASSDAVPAAPGGLIRFFDGSTPLGTAAVNEGAASLSTAGLPAGTRTIVARFDGDGSFESGAAVSSHVIRSASETPVLTLSSSRNPSNVGQPVTIAAEVGMASGAVTGTVQFYSGATLLGESTLSGGRATLTTASLPAGSHPVTARYTGGPVAPPSRSEVLVQAVGAPAWKDRPSTMELSSSGNPAALGDAVVFTATVSGSIAGTAPIGRIVVMVNGEVVGDPGGIQATAGTGSSASVTVSVDGLAHGRHTVTATYLGDSTYKGSTAQVVQAVN